MIFVFYAFTIETGTVIINYPNVLIERALRLNFRGDKLCNIKLTFENTGPFTFATSHRTSDRICTSPLLCACLRH